MIVTEEPMAAFAGSRLRMEGLAMLDDDRGGGVGEV
jgi:hypothetical protein